MRCCRGCGGGSWSGPGPRDRRVLILAALVPVRDPVLARLHVGQAHLRRLPREPTPRPLAPRRARAAQGPRPPRRVHPRGRRLGRRPEGVTRAGPHLHGRARLQGLHPARRLQGDAAGLVGPAGAARRHGPGRHLGRRPLRRRAEPVRRAGAARVLHAALQRLALRAGARERRAPGRHFHPAHQRRCRGDVRRARARRQAGGARRPGGRLPRRRRRAALQRPGVGAALERARGGRDPALLPHPGAAGHAGGASLRSDAGRARGLHLALAHGHQRAGRAAHLLRRLPAPPGLRLRRGRDGDRLDPVLPRAHGLDLQEAPLLDEIDHHRAAEQLLVPAGARDLHRGPSRGEAAPRGGPGEHPLVERLPAQRHDLAALA